MPKADSLVTNAFVLTMDEAGTRFSDGAVAIVGSKIAAVGPAADFATWHIAQRIDARGGILMPGLVNTHTHAAMTLFRGMADDLPLMNWLNDHIFPAEARLDREKVYAGALLACAEMIRSGTTCFCDMYLFEDAVADAAKTAGMRAVVGEVLFDFPSPHYGPLAAGLAFTESLIARWKDDALVSVAVEPHSPYLCAPELLQQAEAISRAHGALLVIHLSETAAEVAELKKRFGKTPVAHLADLGLLSPRLLACHAVVLSDRDIDMMAAGGVKVSHNPESNMKLASGIAPVPALLEAGICVGLGTDGCASNNDLDLFGAMDMAAKLHKVATADPTVVDASTALKLATIDGARALGIGDITGSLEPGKQADLIVIDTDCPHLTPMYHPESQLVYAARGADVALTMVAGKILMQHGRWTTLDVARTMARVREIAAEIGKA
jgi:5-methylthioadenosine/S-adenosylhomocysteine deaminase